MYNTSLLPVTALLKVPEMEAEYFPPRADVILENQTPTDFYILVSGAVVSNLNLLLSASGFVPFDMAPALVSSNIYRLSVISDGRISLRRSMGTTKYVLRASEIFLRFLEFSN